LRQRGKIFNQREQLELKQMIASLNIPISFVVDTESNAIDLDFNGTVCIQSVLVKHNEGYRFDYTTSNGDEKYYENKEWKTFKYYVGKWIAAIKKDNPFEPIQKKNISDLSPKFYKIFREATIINELGFEESSGMIFRKSLEILVKDFLKDYFPQTFEDVINSKTIGGIIYHFYEIENTELIVRNKEKFSTIQAELEALKALANIINNTFQIGNDFSHYERRLTEFNAENMQERIINILNYIDGRIEIKKMINQQNDFDTEFGADKITK